MRPVPRAQGHRVYHQQSTESKFDPDDLDCNAVGVVANEQEARTTAVSLGFQLELNGTVLNDISGTLARDSMLGCGSSPPEVELVMSDNIITVQPATGATPERVPIDGSVGLRSAIRWHRRIVAPAPVTKQDLEVPI